MPAPPLHFLPSLAHPYPLCGVTDAALVTMQPLQVTCPQCQRALEAPRIDFNGPGEKPVSQGKLSEKAFLEQIRKAAGANSWLCFHCHRSDRSEPGFPDVVLAKPGKPVLMAELKTARGKVTREQERWLVTLAQTDGVAACLWRPGDLHAILEMLRQ